VASPAATFGRIRREASTFTLRELVKEVLRAYGRNDLLTFASAIAFQFFFALIPFALFGFGLVGAFGLQDVWRNDVAPDLGSSVSPPAYQLINSTVLKVLGQQQLFWITIGLAIAIWELSSATRGVMDVFDRIYRSERRRSTKERYAISIVIAVGAGALLLGAVAVFTLGPLAGGVMTALRWPLAAILLLGTIAVLVRFAPADPQPIEWVTFGSVLVVVAWLGTSVAFAFYIRNLADYGSVYGALAVVIIAFEYFYLAAVAFLTGAQVDQLIRDRADDG
jgi:membrane protein